MNKNTTIKELIDFIRLTSFKSIKFIDFNSENIIIELCNDQGCRVTRMIPYNQLDHDVDIITYMYQSMLDAFIDYERTKNNGDQ